jgi:DNA-binding protein HU-beta
VWRVNKTGLVAEVAARNGLAKARAAELVDTVFSVIGDALKQKQSVRLAGFGAFAVATQRSAVGYNLRTSEEITIADRLSCNSSREKFSRIW